MIRSHIGRWLKRQTQRAVQYAEARVKRWTQLPGRHLITGAIAAMTRSTPELIAENAFLRQQLIVLQRQTKRPPLTPWDRALLVLFASRLRRWRQALLIVKPDTLLKWHRQGFRLFWRRQSRPKSREPRIPPQTAALIQEMAVANRLWGAKRIRDELRKLDLRVSKRTVQRYMRQARRGLPPYQPRQTWATFLANHAQDIWACDFLQTYDILFRAILIFFIVELDSRRVVHVGVTRTPTDAWVAQQLREATPFGRAPRFLICDNDAKYGAAFSTVAAGSGIKVLRIPVGAPKANAICERFLGSVQRECLDHVLIFSERHLRRIMQAYAGYFNHARPHQGIGSRIPDPSAEAASAGDRIIALPVLGGLHHDYRRVA